MLTMTSEEVETKADQIPLIGEAIAAQGEGSFKERWCKEGHPSITCPHQRSDDLRAEQCSTYEFGMGALITARVSAHVIGVGIA